MTFLSPFHKIAGGFEKPRFSMTQKFGYNAAVTTVEDVWESGGPYTGFLTEELGLVHDVVSSDADDTAAGDGAQTIRVEGLGPGGIIATEDFTLDGLTPVNGAVLFTRINRAYVLTAGSTGTNEGTITIDTTVGNIVSATIGAGMGQTLIACYTIPVTKNGIITRWSAGLSKAAQAAASGVVALQTRLLDDSSGSQKGAWRTKEIMAMNAGTNFDKDVSIAVPARTDIRVRVLSVSSEVLVNAEFNVIEEAI